MTATEAEDKALKLRLNGRALYDVSLERWVELFEDQGRSIYMALQESGYGAVRFCLSLVIVYV
jgi:hypothetical protein